MIKKIKIFIIFSILLIPFLQKGDINHDGRITAYDIVIIQRYLNGYNDNLTLLDLYCMDVDRDFKITINDIVKIQKYIVGLESR